MAILERNTKNIDNIYWFPEENTFPVKNRYTVGIAGQKFFEELKNNGKILGTRCKKCNLTFVPAKMFCELCFEELDEYVDVGKIGEIHTFTIAYFDKNENKKEKPTVIAAIKVADGMLIHKIEESNIDEIKIGIKVEAVFKPKSERKGNILDISHFKVCKPK